MMDFIRSSLNMFTSNRYTTPSTHHLQPVHRTVHTSPTRYIKTDHITKSSVTPHRPNNFNSEDFNHWPFYPIFVLRI
jgi:hypothetical protein